MNFDKKFLKKPRISKNSKTLKQSSSSKVTHNSTLTSTVTPQTKERQNTIRSIVNQHKSNKSTRKTKKKPINSSSKTISLPSQLIKCDSLNSLHTISNKNKKLSDELQKGKALKTQLQQERNKYNDLHGKYKNLLAMYSEAENEYKKQVVKLYNTRRNSKKKQINRVRRNSQNEKEELDDSQSKTDVLNHHLNQLKELLKLSDAVAEEILFTYPQVNLETL